MTAEEIAATKQLLESLGCSVVDSEQGLITCPGKSLHTTPNADADCKLFHNDDGSVRLYCHHTSCREQVDLANRCLASFHKQDKTKQGPTRIPAPKQQQQMEQIRRELLDTFAWPYEKIIADSAIQVPVEQHHLPVLGLFDDDDVVWCGRDVWDTGSPKHACRFRPIKEWLAEPSCPGQFIAPSTFKPGTYSRRAVNVVQRKFLVVESDTLARDDIGAIFRWLDVKIHLRLRAVIDTGGKSLHGWFDYPEAHVLKGLRQWLPGFGCDPAMFNPAQPCRLPGTLRNGQYQRLIFIR
jgi:hypothetical protein